ncbi:hypothetical protein [Actinoplanes sp. NPDC049118]|uniref:hypothetical protein n=1 Tax=Actinoplanes sp. NPDC049118 TaxID=3155769 RepID=UPI0033D383F9
MPGTLARFRRLALTSLAAVTLALPAAACGGPARPATPATPSASADAFTGKWTGLDGACPTLTGTVATSLGRTGSGKPGPADADTPVAQNINCTWGEGEGSVGVSLYLNRSDGPLPAAETTAQEFQRSFDKAVTDGSIRHERPEPGLEDRAYLGIHKDRATIELWVLSSNARVTVFHQVPELDESTWESALAQHRDTMRGLAADVLDDLS